MKAFVIAIAIILLMSSPVHAHRDSLLTVSPDGSIVEIPKALGPVSLVVTGLGTSALAVSFSVKGQSTSLPSCATQFIKTKLATNMQITGSWYHEESTLPYYVRVKFFDPGYASNKSENSSINFLFDMRTSRLISVERFIASKKNDGGQYLPLRLSECF